MSKTTTDQNTHVSVIQAILLSLTFSGLFVVPLGCANVDKGRHSNAEGGRAESFAKQTVTLGDPWEKDFGYVQAVKVRDTIFVAGQLSFDEKGTLQGTDMEAQIRRAYANVEKVLRLNGVAMKDVVEEVIYVTDMQAALAVAPKIRRSVYAEQIQASERIQVASTIVQVSRLAFPEALVEIKVIAKFEMPAAEPPRPSRGDSGSGSGGGRGRRGGGMGSPF